MTTEDIDLTSGVEGARAVVPGPQCGVGRLLADPSRPRLAASLRELMATESARTVYRQLSANRLDIAYQTVQRHMSGICSCARRGIA